MRMLFCGIEFCQFRNVSIMRSTPTDKQISDIEQQRVGMCRVSN